MRLRERKTKKKAKTAKLNSLDDSGMQNLIEVLIERCSSMNGSSCGEIIQGLSVLEKYRPETYLETDLYEKLMGLYDSLPGAHPEDAFKTLKEIKDNYF